MFGTKPSPAKKAFQMANITAAINTAVEKHMMNFTENNVFIFKELFTSATNRDAFVKNLYIYARLKNFIKEGESVYIKHIETGEVIATYISGKVKIYK